MKTESILLVDDNDFALKELVNILKYTGYKNLTSTDNIGNAEHLAVTGDFHCIISAWDMEKQSGIDLLKKVRQNDRLVTLPFFLTDSAFTKQKVIKAGLAGVTGLIVTPYDKENLTSKMESVSEIINKPFFETETRNVNKGMELIEKGHYKEAIVALGEVVNSGESAEYYYNIGYINILKEKYSEAIPAFQKATQLDGLFAKAFEGLGRAYIALGLTGEAERYLQRAVDIYIEKGKLEDAEQTLNDILQISTDSVNIFNSLGVISRKRGDFKTALKQYKKALIIHPDEIYILFNIGRLCIDMKTPEHAIQYFKRALSIKPDFTEAQKALDAAEHGMI